MRSNCAVLSVLLVWVALLQPALGHADEESDETPAMVAVRAESAPVIDGVLDDSIWEQTASYDNFLTSSPDVGLVASQATVVHLAYDDENLYFAFFAKDDEPARIKSSILAWDTLYAGDYVGVYIDALNDQHGAWGFYANAHGSQGDQLFDAGGNSDTAPDKVWQAAGALTEDGYVVEMSIPLRSLRFQSDEDVTMGIGFMRKINRETEQVNYPHYSPFKGSRMSQFDAVVFSGLPWERTWELLPSAIFSEYQVRQGDELVREDKLSGPEVGLTGKIGLTSTLTMDLAVNPDFSQVESDAGQVDVNLRSLTFYPEKRPFFQEGSDYFTVAAAGASAFNAVVHTRNIIDPSYGFRTTGKVGSSNAIGILYAEDEAPGIIDDSGDQATYGAARYQHLFGDESFLGGIYTTRRYRGRDNQVGGLDGFWRISDETTFEGNGLLSRTRESDGALADRTHHVASTLQYRSRSYYARLNVHDVSKNFDLDTGFVPRDGVTYVQPTARRYFYPGSVLQNVNFGYWGYVMQDKYEDAEEGWHNFFVWATMPRSSGFGFWRYYGNELYSGGDFDADGWYATAWSQPTKAIRMTLEYKDEGEPRFTADDPYQGDQKTSGVYVTLEPGERLKAELSFRRQTFDRREDNSRVFDDTLARAKTTFQLNRYFFLRVIVEYRETEFVGEPTERKLQGEFLASFNYLPGTVLYAGYGTLHEAGNTLPDTMNPTDNRNLVETQRSLFLKASYNWRI